MELAILISVNLLISFLVYVAFSVRFRMALEKERKNRIPRAFYDNLQMTIQYINTATNSVDEKTEAFYRLVLKSEEVARRLEKANEEFDKNLKKSKRKRKGGPVSEPEIPDSVSGAKDGDFYSAGGDTPGRSEEPIRPSSRSSSRRSSTLGPGKDTDLFSDRQSYSVDEAEGWPAPGATEPESEREGRHMDRLLSGMDHDVVHFTGQEESAPGRSNVGPAASSGENAGTPSGSRAKNAATGASGLVARIGGMVGRVLGINPSNFQMNGGSEVQESREKINPEASPNRFDREVNRMARAPAFREERDVGRRPEPGSDGFLSSEEELSTGGRRDYYVSGMDPQSDLRKDLYSRKATLPEDRRMPGAGPLPSANSESRFQDSAAGEQSIPEVRQVRDSNTLEREENGLSGDDRNSAGNSAGPGYAGNSSEERRIARVQEFLESTGINLLDTTPQTRAVLIRELGSLGFEPPDIVRATRFPPSEVALVLDLPEASPEERRRTRRIQK
ncbi:MAG: hypothetical protein KDK25_06635 [Leptospiraceae bacterium]|nr:hypothetical protein [Leptospiraceae bacterium]